MVENRNKHKDPIIRVACCVIWGNPYVSRKALPGGRFFASYTQDLLLNRKRKLVMEKEVKQSIFKKWWFWVIAVFVLFLVLGSSSPTSQQTSKTMDDIYKKVSADAVEQYNIANRQGDKIQICVQAGLVSAAYLQEKNESSYQNWKAIQKIDCQKAGIPQ